MKKSWGVILISALFFTFSCKKEQVVNDKINIGTYSGKRFFQSYTAPGIYIDSLTLLLEASKYSYHANSFLLVDSGVFKINKDSITFTDQNLRAAMYSWYMILEGVYKFRISGDSLFLEKQNPQGNILCKLKKVK